MELFFSLVLVIKTIACESSCFSRDKKQHKRIKDLFDLNKFFKKILACESRYFYLKTKNNVSVFKFSHFISTCS